eukprot:scaffold2.g7501.t1
MSEFRNDIRRPQRQQTGTAQRHQPAGESCGAVESLLSAASRALVQNIDRVESLEGIPQEVVCSLFEAVIAQGRLTPQVLALFQRTEHELLVARVKELGVSSWMPPLVEPKGNWLGSRPTWL